MEQFNSLNKYVDTRLNSRKTSIQFATPNDASQFMKMAENDQQTRYTWQDQTERVYAQLLYRDGKS